MLRIKYPGALVGKGLTITQQIYMTCDTDPPRKVGSPDSGRPIPIPKNELIEIEGSLWKPKIELDFQETLTAYE